MDSETQLPSKFPGENDLENKQKLKASLTDTKAKDMISTNEDSSTGHEHKKQDLKNRKTAKPIAEERPANERFSFRERRSINYNLKTKRFEYENGEVNSDSDFEINKSKTKAPKKKYFIFFDI